MSSTSSSAPEFRQNFWIKLDDLAHDLKDLLEFVESPGAATRRRQTGQGAVYLAVTTGDLQDQRDAIQRDLQQHGYTVLPAQSLPNVGDGRRGRRARGPRALRDVDPSRRQNATASRPKAALSSLIEIQNELAIERAEQGAFSRLLWIPPALQVDDARQQQVIDRLRTDPRVGPRTPICSRRRSRTCGP